MTTPLPPAPAAVPTALPPPPRTSAAAAGAGRRGGGGGIALAWAALKSKPDCVPVAISAIESPPPPPPALASATRSSLMLSSSMLSSSASSAGRSASRGAAADRCTTATGRPASAAARGTGAAISAMESSSSSSSPPPPMVRPVARGMDAAVVSWSVFRRFAREGTTTSAVSCVEKWKLLSADDGTPTVTFRAAVVATGSARAGAIGAGCLRTAAPFLLEAGADGAATAAAGRLPDLTGSLSSSDAADELLVVLPVAAGGVVATCALAAAPARTRGAALAVVRAVDADAVDAVS